MFDVHLFQSAVGKNNLALMGWKGGGGNLMSAPNSQASNQREALAVCQTFFLDK